MTRIEFYFNVPDKHEMVENLVQLALTKRRQITILTSDEAVSASISDYLWQNKPTSFLPNLRVNHVDSSTQLSSPQDKPLNLSQTALTPIVIGSQIDRLTFDDMLINLTPSEPVFFSRFTQLIEIISLNENDKMTGRQRYKFYRDRGYEIKNIDYSVTSFE